MIVNDAHFIRIAPTNNFYITFLFCIKSIKLWDDRKLL